MSRLHRERKFIELVMDQKRIAISVEEIRCFREVDQGDCKCLIFMEYSDIPFEVSNRYEEIIGMLNRKRESEASFENFSWADLPDGIFIKNINRPSMVALPVRLHSAFRALPLKDRARIKEEILAVERTKHPDILFQEPTLISDKYCR